MALHILADYHNVIEWQLVLNYMRTPPIHYYLASSGQAACMETHHKHTNAKVVVSILEHQVP